MNEPRFIKCGNQTINLNLVAGVSYVTGKPSPQVDHYAKLTVCMADGREIVYWDALADAMYAIFDDTALDIAPEPKEVAK